MRNRLTISGLLKSGVLTTAAVLTVVCSLFAWDAWQRLQVAGRVVVIAEASADLFKAMHTLRAYRSMTNVTLTGDGVVAPDLETYLRGGTDTLMQAMRAGAAELGSFEFTDRATLFPEFVRLMEAQSGRQADVWDAMNKPKASRPPSLAKEYMANTAGLLAVLDKISGRLVADVKHSDAVIDQLLMIKQMAWLLRNTAGDASLMVSNGLAAGRLAPDARQAYAKAVGGIPTAWSALELATAGNQLPAPLADAIAAAKTAHFDGEYTELRDRLLNALLNGEKPEMEAAKWSSFSVGRMSSAVLVAERALDAAKAHASAQQALALRALLFQVALLSAAIAAAFAAMMAVGRRVIRPLHRIRDAMLQVASGNLSVDAGYSERQDEIGALAGALETFKRQAADKLRIEAQEHERHIAAARRQQGIEAQVAEFESGVRQTLQELGHATSQMRTTSASLSAVSSQTNARVGVAENASGEASRSVESVASASQQLSTSINNISRQAAQATRIASRAVDQARDTDGTVQGLAQTAGRIGEVVDLINSIAAQTNLLALNATIEAARAGDAGRGFAVVASEVKSLATQTAKATDDISEQIADIQNVAGKAIDAIKGIGGIIAEVNAVATAIAVAVQEQGSATEEISRSIRQAAQGTSHVSENITGVKQDADAAADAAEAVRRASETLEAQSEQLGGQVTDFLGKIRVA
jgi:methyl-accepting chemotaxis protein